MLRLETVADLNRLITDEIQESLTLDYKSSASLGRSNEQRNELIKDISAFTNSAGGQVVYGIVEIDRKPVRIDAGSDPATVSREWIEQVIDSNVQPRIEGLIIRPIPLEGGNFVYVIEAPAAVTRAPHQAMDKKYYKRQNFQSIPMEDYEIRDSLRRAVYAEPFATFSFKNGLNKIDVELVHGSDYSEAINLDITLGNKSSQPAYYSIFTLYIDHRLNVLSQGHLENGGKTNANDGRSVNLYRKKMGIPGVFPLFRETSFALCVPPFSFRVPNLLLDSGHKFLIGYEIRTPGHHVSQIANLSLPNRVMEIQMEPPIVNR